MALLGPEEGAVTLTCSVSSPQLFLLPIPTLMPTFISPGCVLHAVGPPVHDDPPVPRLRGRHCHLPLPRPLRRLLHHHHGPHRLRAGGAHAGVPGHRVPHGADGRAHDRGHAHSRLVPPRCWTRTQRLGGRRWWQLSPVVVFWCETTRAGLSFLPYQVMWALKSRCGIAPCYVLWHLRPFLQADER